MSDTPEQAAYDLADSPAARELHRLRNLLGLAAFAAEARRILTGLDVVLETHATPGMDKTLECIVPCRGQWRIAPDTLGEVLLDARERLSVLLNMDD